MEYIVAPTHTQAHNHFAKELAEEFEGCQQEAPGVYWDSTGETLTKVDHIATVLTIHTQDVEGRLWQANITLRQAEAV